MGYVFSLLATTFGVMLGLVMSAFAGYVRRRLLAREMKRQLLSEIKSVKNDLEQLNTEDGYSLEVTKTPVYQGFVFASKIAYLEKYDWYTTLLKFYSELDKFNSWHATRTKQAFSNNAAIAKLIEEMLKPEQVRLQNDASSLIKLMESKK